MAPTILASLVVMATVTHAQWASMVGNGQTTQCKYEFTVPSSQGCSQGDASVKQALETLKVDIDHGRLSQVSSNSHVQRQIYQVTSDINGLAVDLDTVKTRVASLPTTQTSTVATLQMAVDQLSRDVTSLKGDVFSTNSLLLHIRDDLEKKLAFVVDKVSSLEAALTNEKYERFRVEAALQGQLRAEHMDTGRMSFRLLVLEQKFANLTRPATAVPPPASSPTSPPSQSPTTMGQNSTTTTPQTHTQTSPTTAATPAPTGPVVLTLKPASQQAQSSTSAKPTAVAVGLSTFTGPSAGTSTVASTTP